MKAGYQPVYNDSQSHSSTEDSETLFLPYDAAARPACSRTTYCWLLTINAVFFVLSLLLSAYVLFGCPKHVDCITELATYSPARGAIQYKTVKFDFSTPSEYVGANESVDEAWDRITYDIGDQMVTKEELNILENPRRHCLSLIQRLVCMAIELLHCLNMLRKATYRDYYAQEEGGDFTDPKPMVRGHLDHCIEILRTNLMCQSDVGVFTFHEVPGLDGPWPDFENLHVCRNFERIREWAVEHAVAHDNI